MCSRRGNAALPALGFPIRESTGQRLFNTSPLLIAVVHALLRLLMPRHPPCALTILTVITTHRVATERQNATRQSWVIPNEHALLVGHVLDEHGASTPCSGQLCSFQGPTESPAAVCRSTWGPQEGHLQTGRRAVGLSKLNSMRWQLGHGARPIEIGHRCSLTPVQARSTC